MGAKKLKEEILSKLPMRIKRDEKLTENKYVGCIGELDENGMLVTKRIYIELVKKSPLHTPLRRSFITGERSLTQIGVHNGDREVKLQCSNPGYFDLLEKRAKTKRTKIYFPLTEEQKLGKENFNFYKKITGLSLKKSKKSRGVQGIAQKGVEYLRVNGKIAYKTVAKERKKTVFSNKTGVILAENSES